MEDLKLADGLLYAFDVRENASATKLTPEDVNQPVPADVKYRWVHIDLTWPGARDWVSHHTDKTVAATLTLEDTRPRCARHDDGIILNLRGVNLNPEADPEDMVSVRIWIEKNLIISVRRKRLMAIVALRERIEAGNPPADIGDFLTSITTGLTERMDPIISDLTDKVDDVEELSLQSPGGLRSEIANLRRVVIMLRRFVGPQREALSQLSILGTGFLDEFHQIALREAIDRITRMVEEMDTVRERGAILHDQITDYRAEEMNRNMLVLSVVAAIFLPLGFLTGLLGVIIAGIPGSDYPAAFLIFCFILLIISAGLLVWFRQKKWI